MHQFGGLGLKFSFREKSENKQRSHVVVDTVNMEDPCTASHSEPKNINDEPNNNAALKVIENCVNQREKRVDLSKKSLQVFPKGFFNLKHVQVGVSRVSLKYLIHSTYSS